MSVQLLKKGVFSDKVVLFKSLKEFSEKEPLLKRDEMNKREKRVTLGRKIKVCATSRTISFPVLKLSVLRAFFL